MSNPFKRCTVCGFRRWFHWLHHETFYTRPPVIGPPPKRGWIL